jgi:Fe-S cluster biogenesis protein NfuA
MELVDVDCKKKSISIKITGACIDCEFFDQTFDQGIKQSLIKSHPEVEHVHFIRHSDLDDELSTAPKSKLKK